MEAKIAEFIAFLKDKAYEESLLNPLQVYLDNRDGKIYLAHGLYGACLGIVTHEEDLACLLSEMTLETDTDNNAESAYAKVSEMRDLHGLGSEEVEAARKEWRDVASKFVDFNAVFTYETAAVEPHPDLINTTMLFRNLGRSYVT